MPYRIPLPLTLVEKAQKSTQLTFRKRRCAGISIPMAYGQTLLYIYL